MNDRVESLLRLFMEKITDRYEGVEYRPAQGAVIVVSGGTEVWLYFDEKSLLAFLDEAGEDGTDAWDVSMTDEEAAARFLSIHLDEALDTSSLPLSRRWRYQRGGFDQITDSRRTPS